MNSDKLIKIDAKNSGPVFSEETERKDGQLNEQNDTGGKEAIKLEGEELDEYIQEKNKILDNYQKFFTIFARDISLTHKMGNQGFSIDLEKGIINLDANWFAERNFSKEQIIWGVLHEISHFREMIDDPKGEKMTTEHLIRQAKLTGQILLKKWETAIGEKNPEYIDRLKQPVKEPKDKPEKWLTNIEWTAYKIHHTFANVMRDIFVNNDISERIITFEEEDRGGQEVKRLYKEQLFKDTDYVNLPRHLQYVYKLIREEMVKDETVIVTPEVESALQKTFFIQGKRCSTTDIIQEYLRPISGKKANLTSRLAILENTLESVYNELLERDLKDWKPELPQNRRTDQNGGGGENSANDQDDTTQEEAEDKNNKKSGSMGNPFADDYKKQDNNNPDKIDHSDIDKWLDKQAQDKKADTEGEKTAEQKAKEAQEEMDKKWCADNKINRGSYRRYKEIENQVRPYMQSLSQLWKKIIYGSGRESFRQKEGFYRDGELFVPQAIEEWPKIIKGDYENIRIMKKDVEKERLVQKPELIRVHLVCDQSGSMFDIDYGDKESRKILALKQVYVQVMSSLNEFNNYLDLSRQSTKSKLKCETEAWVFGDKPECKIIKPMTSKNPAKEMKSIIESIDWLGYDLGYTYDNVPLNEISQKISVEEQKKIAQGKILEIVIEITDGSSNDSHETKKAISALYKKGVIIRAIQIGADRDEQEVFNDIWNEGRPETLGQIIGYNYQKLPIVIAELLKKYLNNVKL